MMIGCLFSLQGLVAQPQIKSFSEDPVKFIAELETYFEATDKKAGREYVEEFTKLYWITNKVDDSKKQAVYKNCNQMLKRRFKPTPEFTNYLNAVKAFVDNNLPATTWSDWQVCFDKMAAGKSNINFAGYIEMSENLFNDNTFYKSITTTWKADNRNWQIVCDSVPLIKFTSLNLKCYSKGDSSSIYNTSGVFNPVKGEWVGKGGKVNWRRVGIPESEVYAELRNYKITLKSGGYDADTVTYYNKSYFQGKPIQGKLSEKIVADATDKNASFPKFQSYSQRYQIKSLFPNVDFEGGFTQVGSRIIGSGTKTEPAFVVFKRNSKDFLRVNGQSFVITKERLTCADAGVRFMLDKDSIVHPNLDFKYFIDSNKVVLYRSGDGITATPYYDSYHKIDIDAEQIVWRTDEPRIVLRTLPGSSLGEADFISSSYFRQYIYDKILGMESIHPLVRIRDFVYKKNDSIRDFTVTQLASYWKISPENLRPTLLPLSNAGFIIYDVRADEITAKDKLFTYVLARAKQVDYDVLDFQSKVQPGTPNASINLLNNDLTILGVEEVALSDSQNVTVFPKEGVVILKKNRNFTFQGSIMAGRFDYYGKQFSFDYDAFKLNLNNVDSVRIWVDGDKPDPQDPRGRPIQVKVTSVIENLNGELLIDLPANKSGIKPYPKYPVFTSSKESFVYYDKPSIHKGVYKRDDFYFKLDPFTIDSLDNFSNEGLKFLGTFKSAGIFPEMRDTLTLQPDYSLGFLRRSPPGGLSNYGTKAKFNQTFRLSNQGLHGNGSIDYQTSNIQSDDFLFFPDSVSGIAQTFVMREQKGKVEFPEAKGENVKVGWSPKKDKMRLTSQDKKFSMYNASSEFGGTLTLTPKDLSGNGRLEFSTAEMDSKKMVFKQHIVDADTSDFRLKALELAGLAFDTKNMNAHLDFEKREGEFKANGKGSIVTFPVNQYICYMEQFKWYMDKSEIEMGTPDKPKSGQTDINIEGPEFISIHPKQDSLRFNAPKAKYDLKNYIISAREVKKINVADAEIIPHKGDVVIEKNAKMQTLENAEIVANAVTRYHKVFNATVNVYARKSYDAYGDYAYVDELKQEQIIHFAKISPDTSGQSYAEGSISDSAKFTLSPAFDFRGKVVMAANNQFLEFNGSTRLTHDCSIGKARMKFKSEINPLQIMIPVTDKPVDHENVPIGLGIMSTLVDSARIYSGFLSPQEGKSDVRVITSDGFLVFDKPSQEYRVANKEKLVERSLPGNYIAFSTRNCSVTGEGKMNLGTDLGQVKLVPIGNSTNFSLTDSTIFDLMLIVDFFFDDGIMDKMADMINANSGLAPTDFSSPTFQRALTELVGKEKADKYITQLNLYGSFKKFPDELKYALLFNDVKMKWNQKARSYMSVGKLGLGNVNKNQINKFVEGKIQLERKRGGDVLHIYFELDGGNWYYFKYVNGLMIAISSNDAFNNAIKELKDEKKKVEAEKGGKPYRYTIGNPQDKGMFLKKWDRANAGSEE